MAVLGFPRRCGSIATVAVLTSTILLHGCKRREVLPGIEIGESGCTELLSKISDPDKSDVRSWSTRIVDGANEQLMLQTKDKDKKNLYTYVEVRLCEDDDLTTYVHNSSEHWKDKIKSKHKKGEAFVVIQTVIDRSKSDKVRNYVSTWNLEVTKNPKDKENCPGLVKKVRKYHEAVIRDESTTTLKIAFAKSHAQCRSYTKTFLEICHKTEGEKARNVMMKNMEALVKDGLDVPGRLATEGNLFGCLSRSPYGMAAKFRKSAGEAYQLPKQGLCIAVEGFFAVKDMNVEEGKTGIEQKMTCYDGTKDNYDASVAKIKEDWPKIKKNNLFFFQIFVGSYRGKYYLSIKNKKTEKDCRGNAYAFLSLLDQDSKWVTPEDKNNIKWNAKPQLAKASKTTDLGATLKQMLALLEVAAKTTLKA